MKDQRPAEMAEVMGWIWVGRVVGDEHMEEGGEKSR